MAGGRRSFSFVGKAGERAGVAPASAASKANVVFAIIDAGVQVIKAAGKALEFAYEMEKTRELGKQIDYAREMLETRNEEALKRARIEIEETKNRITLELEQERQSLEKNEEILRQELSNLEKKGQIDYEHFIAKMKVTEDIMHSVKNTMELAQGLLEQEGGNPSYLAHLEEEIRICSQKYDELAKQLV